MWRNPAQEPDDNFDRCCTVDRERFIRGINDLILSGELQNARDILVVGCTTGFSAFYVAQEIRNPHVTVTGLDSESFIYYAKMTYALQTGFATRLRYIKASSIITFPESTAEDHLYDIVVGDAWLSWIPKTIAPTVMKNVAEVIRPGGMFCGRVTATGNRPYRVAAKNVSCEPKWAKFFLGYTPPFNDLTEIEYKTYLESAGFVNVTVRRHNTFEDTFFFRTHKALITYMSTWLPQLSQLKADSKEELQKLRMEFCLDVVNSYCDLIKWDNASKIPLYMPALYGVGYLNEGIVDTNASLTGITHVKNVEYLTNQNNIKDIDTSLFSD